MARPERDVGRIRETLRTLQRVPKPDHWDDMVMHEKIQHYGAHLSEIHSLLTDKLLAKAYVRSLAPEGDDVLAVPEVIRVLDGPDDVREEDLAPDRMIKATHGCKWNIVGGSQASSSSSVESVRKQLAEWAGASFKGRTSTTRKTNGTTQSTAKGSRPSPASHQAQYEGIPPRFFVERIVPAVGPLGQAVCYMVRCVDGRPISLSAVGAKQNQFDITTGEPTDVQDPTIPPPVDHRRMLDLAARLSAGLEFVRVDFYSTEQGKLYFSELTFTPAAGRRVFGAEEERRQAALWPRDDASTPSAPAGTIQPRARSVVPGRVRVVPGGIRSRTGTRESGGHSRRGIPAVYRAPERGRRLAAVVPRPGAHAARVRNAR